MSWVSTLWRRVRPLRQTEREIEEELRFHIEMRTRENVGQGMPPEQAAADALRRFGDYQRVRGLCHQVKEEESLSVRAWKGLTWLLAGCGLTLQGVSEILSVQKVGHVLLVIALAWRLLIHLRGLRPATRPEEIGSGNRLISAVQADGKALGLGEGGGPQAAPYDERGQTPVERLLEDKS